MKNVMILVIHVVLVEIVIIITVILVLMDITKYSEAIIVII